MSTEHPDRAATLWIDASSGVAGDMLLGALLDAGASLERVQAAVDAVVPGLVRLGVAETRRAGMRALKVDVQPTSEDQPHRSWAEVEQLVLGAELPAPIARRAHAAFAALARAEADVHGVPVEEVHFHEVGAWDSIADVVGVCAALEDLAVTDVVTSVIGVGSGTVQGAHGRMPVPVPAVLGLVTGWTVDAVGDGELATPTGVALLTTLAASQGPLPRMAVSAVGVGAGTRDVPGRANVVRVVLGRLSTPPAPQSGSPTGDLEHTSMVVLEANVDDLDPRVWPSVLDALLAAGAADAWLAPILMKKGRPAHTLSVLCAPDDAERLRDLVLEATSTIGVRGTAVDRWALPRQWVAVDVDGQRIGIKVAHRAGRVVQATPEFADVEAAGGALDRPVGIVLDAAVAAAAAAGLVPGAPLPTASARGLAQR
ncbi:nickel pincer cofactor biosynthesis protein LarC [Intrasporangium calvum]|uniref:Pyridinium-3,5-bisthiocarboxylic acid mononucleotide nickel insertion protein n=1 Tax=Intrasporangium calvum TaxID=53358 RepID=A0ABT5GFW8_9MICO|nr:nickel pincer cofactor biosynthesis protein LarC [Intrasporangium calvum]MDC5696780.1 nickel pincer cofactor biosynthesis protein LarC [Intrasporangium calvum]